MQTLTPDTVPAVIKDDNVEVRLTQVGEMTVLVHPPRRGHRPRARPRRPRGQLVPVSALGLHAGRSPAHAGTRRRPAPTRPGEAFYWAPGHAPFALTDCAYVDFSPTAEFNAVITHLTKA